ncbi:beta strand repeat-containing protein, partial [Chloroflexus sp.]|uniref:beta strand repeat-containing protein n=1 Tax=Chloroflexus sp. TaxID=1904827 RepID=UPI002ADDBAB6
SLTVNEGDTATYTVRLGSQPTADVTVTIDGQGQIEFSGQPTITLTFTAANWNVDQAVTFTVIDDPNDESPAGNTYAVTISHVAGSTDPVYNALAPAPLTLTITETESAGLVITPATLTVAEGGPATTYTVVLTSEPIANVTVTIDGQGQVTLDGQATLTLTFSPGNWNIPQAVSVQAIDDLIDETSTGTTYDVTLLHILGGGDPVYASLPSTPLTVTIGENDIAGVVIDPTTLTVAEGGPAATYTVVLTSQPTANVTVTIDGQGQVTLNGQATFTLTFTPANWNIPQIITIQAIDDLIDETLTGTTYDVTLLHILGGGDPVYASLPAAPLTVTIGENDTAGVVIDPTTLTVAEGGPAATYTVVLTSQPTANVTVTVDGQGQVTLDGQATLTLTFSPGNWNTAQTVNVEAIDDQIDETPGISYDVTLLNVLAGGDPVYTSLPAVPLTVTIIENDTAGLNFSPTSLTITEGIVGTYEVSLTSEPLAPVTVVIDGAGLLQVNGGATATLIFDDSNWNNPQTVSVLEPNVDQIAQPPRNRTITHATTSVDPAYSGLSGIILAVTVNDDDIPDIVISATTLTVTEGGSVNYSVALATQPTANVTVTIDGQGQVTLNGQAILNLTFTPATWNTPQPVTIAVPEDAIAEATQTIAITHLASSSDPFYDGLSGPALDLTITDNDTAGFVVTVPPAPLIVSENGDSIELRLRLTSQPTAPVQVNISVSDPTEGSVTPTSIIFDNTNWNIDAILTVTGVDDLLEDGHQPFTVQLAPAISSDPFYNGLPPTPNSVNVLNRDNEPVRISIDDVTRFEGDSGVTNSIFIVRINRVSDRDILFDYTTTDGTALAILDYGASAGTLTIPAGSLQVTLPVGVIGDTLAEDDEFFTVNLSNPRATLPGQPSTIVTDETVVISDGIGVGIIRDDDPPALRFATGDVVVNENAGLVTLTVTLSRAATVPVSVDYATITGGTAQPGDGSAPTHDYVPVSGTLNFAVGETSRTFMIQILNNASSDQPFETILVSLSNPTGATLGDPSTATVTIVDAAPVLLTQDPTALQTAGPNYTTYSWNFYGTNGGISIIRIDVPCGVSGQLAVELLSPSINPAANFIDAIRGAAESTTFALYRMPVGWQAGDGYPPTVGTLVTSATYPPNTGDATTWVALPGIPSTTPCGVYLLVASVPDNDTNGWAVRSGWSGSSVPTVDLDGIPGSGDEIVQSIVRQTLRHPPGTPFCTTFFQYVAPGQSSVAFHNFDLNDVGSAWVRYYPPGSVYDPTAQSGGIAGTASADGQWNNGTATTRGGDVILSPQPGWWRIVTCTNSATSENHFIQEGQTGIPLYLNIPPTPDVVLQASSVSSVSTGNTFNLAVDYTNRASGITAGAARNFQITITLPNGISFGSGACAGTPGTCTISGQTMTINVGLLAAGSSNIFSIPLVAGANPVGSSPIAVQATATDQSGHPYQRQDYVIVRIVP